MYKLKVVLNDKTEVVLKGLKPRVTANTCLYSFQTLYELYRWNLVKQNVDVKEIYSFVVYQPELGYSFPTFRPDDFKPFMNILS